MVKKPLKKYINLILKIMWSDYNRKPTKQQLFRAKVRRIKRALFYEYVDRGDNGVMGPGFENYSYYKISYAKIACYLALIAILIFIYKK